jgi:hypothetical protein
VIQTEGDQGDNFIQAQKPAFSERLANWTVTFAVRYSRVESVLIVVALWIGQSTRHNTRHEARAREQYCLTKVVLWSRKPCHLRQLIRVMDKIIASSIMPLAWTRILLPIVQQLRHCPPHELACELVLHLLGRIHRCTRVWRTNLPHLLPRCLHDFVRVAQHGICYSVRRLISKEEIEYLILDCLSIAMSYKCIEETRTGLPPTIYLPRGTLSKG